MELSRPLPIYPINKDNIIALLLAYYPDREIHPTFLDDILEYIKESNLELNMNNLSAACVLIEQHLKVLDFIHNKPEFKCYSTGILFYGLVLAYGDKFKHNFKGNRFESMMKRLKNSIEKLN